MLLAEACSQMISIRFLFIIQFINWVSSKRLVISSKIMYDCSNFIKINFVRCLPQPSPQINLLNTFHNIHNIIWQQMLCNYVDVCDRQMCTRLWKRCRFFCADRCTPVSRVIRYGTSDININSQMKKKKRYILVRDVVRIDYFIQRILSRPKIYMHCPMCSRRFRRIGEREK